MINRLSPSMRTEAGQIFRFIIIGGLSFLIYAAMYALLSRVVWTAGNRTVESFISTVVSALFNYVTHRSWTFRSRGSHGRQVWRYVLTVGSASLIQTGLFWLGHEIFHIYDFILIFTISALMPCYTYVMHKLFTFRPGKPASSGAAEMV
jgi:putative flippase GtrA